MLGMRMYRRALRRAARSARRLGRRRGRVLRGMLRGLRLARGIATLVIIGAVVYKLTNRDVDRIEQATGKRAEELTEAELENAIERLRIQPLELDDEDERAIRSAETRRLSEDPGLGAS